MRTQIAIVAALLAACGATPGPELASENDKLNYSVGYQIGGDLARQGVEVVPEVLARGIRDAVQGGSAALPPEEMQSVLAAAGQRMAEAERQRRATEAARVLQEGRAFLEENRKREGVRTLDSGLQYEVLEEGTGEHPNPGGRATVHYRGTLVDGVEFDSSYSRNKPFTFAMSGVIPAWRQALPLMKEGAKWRLFVPTELAYGERGFGSKIPPNAALVFEVELLDADGQ